MCGGALATASMEFNGDAVKPCVLKAPPTLASCDLPLAFSINPQLVAEAFEGELVLWRDCLRQVSR